MEFEEEKSGNASVFSGNASVFPGDEKAAEDSFYEKLSKLNESSGLTLLFNFRETMFNLHVFYKQVIKRGGFRQVTEGGKWDEVESALNLKSSSPAQLQKLYEMLLLQFEQMYSKMPEQVNKSSGKSSLDPLSSSIGKRKNCDGLSLSQVYSDDLDDPAEKRKISGDTSQVAAAGPKTMNHKNSTRTTLSYSSNEKEFRKNSGAPMKPRSGYQIFLRLECHRLKLIHGESSGSQNIRDIAINAWRCLPDKDKKPYIEASKMDKERYDRELAYYNWRGNYDNAKSQCLFSNSAPRMLSFSRSTSLEKDNDYHVSLPTERDDTLLPDQSMVNLAMEVMKNAESSDAMFQIDWDSSYLNIPN